MAVKTQVLPDKSWLYIDDDCVMRSHALGDGLLLTTCRGVQSDAFAALIIADGTKQLREHGRCVFMVDATLSSRMTTQFREQMTAWFKDNKGKVRVHMLIKSKLLEMALNVANLIIGMDAARAYSRASEWEAAGRAESPKFRRLALDLPEAGARLDA
jgi:hypothetical protein